MRSPARSSCASAALAAALMALITGMGTDYPADAGPAISALARLPSARGGYMSSWTICRGFSL